MAARVTLKAINDELTKCGHNASQEKSSGYFYFFGGEATDWIDRTVPGTTVGARTLDQWIVVLAVSLAMPDSCHLRGASKPTPCPVLELKIALAECPLQSAFLKRHDDGAHDSAQDQGSGKHGDAAEEDCPPDPDRYFGNVHRIAGECIRAGHHQNGGVNPSFALFGICLMPTTKTQSSSAAPRAMGIIPSRFHGPGPSDHPYRRVIREMAHGTTPCASGMATNQANGARINATHLGMLMPFDALALPSAFGPMVVCS